MPERYPPDDPREWLNRALSNLTMAKMQSEGVYLEDLCFQAQQAVEKAVKALLIKHCVEFPYTHDIAQLLTMLEETGQGVPEYVRMSERLTVFAVIARYPGTAPPISRGEYSTLLAIAERVIQWVTDNIAQKPI